MRRAAVWIGVCGAAAVLHGCGYAGDPLPPALNIPVKIVDLTGIQRGGTIVVAFTPSLTTTENLLLKEFGGMDLRIGTIPEEGFEMARWSERATPIQNVPAKAERTVMEIPARDWVGKEVVVAVRAIGTTKRPGEWSNLLNLRIVEPPAPPVVRPASHPQGAVLTWDRGGAPEGSKWRIWRREESEKEAVAVGTAEEPVWVDQAAAYGKTYTWMVQLLVPTGARDAESPLSAPVSLKPEDAFAPDVPGGLSAIAGVKTVELAWERVTSADVAGYVVMRAAGDGPLGKLAGPVENPSYSDAQVESGRKYRYAVAAVDAAGNQSAPSSPVEITAP